MSGMDHPIELDPPDISPYRSGNTGVDYTATLDSGRSGPHVAIVGLMHGNEPCGAVAIDFLFRNVRPLRGRLTLALANVAAYARFDPSWPGEARFVAEDMNRLWDDGVLDGPRGGPEIERARALRPLLAGVDALLDLHSMQGAGEPLALCGVAARGRALALGLGWPRWVVADAGHAAGRRLIDHPAFSGPGGTAAAILVECGQHWARATGRAAIEASLRFLLRFGMVGPEEAGPCLSPPPLPAQRVVEVTHAVAAETDAFAWARPFGAIEVVGPAGTVVGHDGGRPVATPYPDCVLVMPARRARRGQTAVRLGRLAGAP